VRCEEGKGRGWIRITNFNETLPPLPKLALVCLFCVIVYLCFGRMLAFVVLDLVYLVLAKRLFGKNVSEMTNIVSSWT